MRRLRKALHNLAAHLLAEHLSPTKIGWAVGLGLFVGTLPVYGLHLPICIGLATLFRLNKVTMYLAAHISIPPLAPFLVAAGIALGEWLRFGTWRGIIWAEGANFVEQIGLLSGQIPDLYLSCFLGDAVLGLGLGAIGGTLAAFMAKRRMGRPKNTARSPEAEPKQTK